MTSESSGEFMNLPNKETVMPKIEVLRISDGLEFGEGSISLEDRLGSTEQPINQEVINKVESVIESDDILVPIDLDDDMQPVVDDGCGDGRLVKRIFEGRVERKRSLNRAKAFGGGLVMAVASTIGRGKAVGRQFKQVFRGEADHLDTNKIPYGAHTDDHATGENGGCGAIDKAPLIVSNAVKYQESIRSTIKQLTQGGHDDSKLDRIFSNYGDYADEVKLDVSYSGKEIVEEILDRDKVVKELAGPHLETHIVINTIRGFTVNQGLIREISDGNAQVFAVDAWHMQDLATKLYDNPAEQEEAYLSMLVYTLATAATLTKGDLPVYVVSVAQ